MIVNLPTELLRSFNAIVESGSMLRATERVFVTQSALSLQMKRLEEMVQAPLFRRQGRHLALTPAGESMLDHAREILAANDRAVAAFWGKTLAGPARIGVAEDFADTLLSALVARFSGSHPETQLQVRVGSSPELLELLQADRIDVLLATGAESDPHAIRTLPMAWLGQAPREDEPVPLLAMERNCRFRDAAIAALEKAGRAYRVVLETPNLSALKAAVKSGLGVTCRTSHFFERAAEIAGTALPPLPRVAYTRHIRPSPHPTIAGLGELMSLAALQL